jgi:phosphopantothenoylcysteine synthetase/decarboxylase
MNILVTAGNTLVPIDRVRCLTNIFTGRTGAAIALTAHARGHMATLLTSHAEVIPAIQPDPVPLAERWTCRPYRTFEDLQDALARTITAGGLDAVIHCAAVSDYLAGGVYAPAEGTRFDPTTATWHGKGLGLPALVDRLARKVKSDEAELWLRLVRAPKLIDRIRTDWGFTGVLVKFKLEVGTSDEALLEVAERSRQHSHADLMVANTLEDSTRHAFLGPVEGRYRKVARAQLATELIQVVERLVEERTHG